MDSFFTDSISTKDSLKLYESNRQVAGTIKYNATNGFEVDSNSPWSERPKNRLGTLCISGRVDTTLAWRVIFGLGDVSANATRPAAFDNR